MEAGGAEGPTRSRSFDTSFEVAPSDEVEEDEEPRYPLDTCRSTLGTRLLAAASCEGDPTRKRLESQV